MLSWVGRKRGAVKICRNEQRCRDDVREIGLGGRDGEEERCVISGVGRMCREGVRKIGLGRWGWGRERNEISGDRRRCREGVKKIGLCGWGGGGGAV